VLEFFYKSCMKNFSPSTLKEITQTGEVEEKPTVKYTEGE